MSDTKSNNTRGPTHSMQGRPLVLDFDDSVLPLGLEDTKEIRASLGLQDIDEIRIPLGALQEKIRFGCPLQTYGELERRLDSLMPDAYGCVFTGSGDYHHLSLYLLRRLAVQKKLAPQSLDLVVCDNHPDNMRYPFGVHCGSWVRHAAALPFIRHIHVIGITSPDIGLAHAFENYLTPFMQEKLSYWSIGSGAPWLSILGRATHNRHFATANALVAAFCQELQKSDTDLYLSIDKDVFSPAVVRTNWDQGLFEPGHMESLLHICAGKIIGGDVTGDASTYAYAGWFKRLLSRLDGQEQPTPEQLTSWRQGQRVLNLRLLKHLGKHGIN